MLTGKLDRSTPPAPQLPRQRAKKMMELRYTAAGAHRCPSAPPSLYGWLFINSVTGSHLSHKPTQGPDPINESTVDAIPSLHFLPSHVLLTEFHVLFSHLIFSPFPLDSSPLVSASLDLTTCRWLPRFLSSILDPVTATP